MKEDILLKQLVKITRHHLRIMTLKICYKIILISRMVLSEKKYSEIKSILEGNFPSFINLLRTGGKFEEAFIVSDSLVYEFNYENERFDLPVGISVVVATLGERPSLQKTILSISENARNLEIQVVLVSPMSQHENIKKIVSQNLEAGPNIHLKFVNDEKNGIYEAMNLGIVNADKEFILFLNDDDYLIPGSLQKVFSGVENLHQIDLISGISAYHYECCDYFHPTFPEKILGSRIKHGAMSTSHQSQIWRKTTLLNLEGFRTQMQSRSLRRNISLRLASDFDIFVRSTKLPIKYCASNVFISVMNPTGISVTAWKRTYKELLKIVWHVAIPGWRWLLYRIFLVHSIKRYHSNSSWLHEH